MFDSIVVGKGLFGCAALRHLAARSANVAIIGPDEPQEASRHTGVFASHYDQGRLQRHMSRDLVWGILSQRAFREYAEIEEQSGITFYQAVDSVHLASRNKRSVFLEAAPETASRLGIDHTVVTDGREVTRYFPMLRFPEECHGYIEHYPAGYINPRDLIRAQLAIAAGRGATILREIVAKVRNRRDRVEVVTAEGRTHEARKVLVAVGPYTNCFELLTRKLALRVKSEIILLARVSDCEVARLDGMPTMIYELDAPPIETIYMLPPMRYPDGNYYVKMGCNTAVDHYPSTAEEMSLWVRAGDSDTMKGVMAEAMRSIIPGLREEAMETRRCLVTYTPSFRPFIDCVDGERIFVATGGNAMGAKSSDAIGKLAAELMHHGRWVDELAHDNFRAFFADDAARQGLEWGACGMAKLSQTQLRGGEQEKAAEPERNEADRGEPFRIRRLDAVSFEAACDVEASHLYPWKGVVETPFSSAWLRVGPGETTRAHMHHEGETWIVVEGEGVITANGASREVRAGDVILFPPFSNHSLHNPSDAGRVVFLSLWWEDMSLASRQASEGRAQGSTPKRVAVTVTPLTPNGDLHLGHLAGPYLGADVFARFLRMQGHEVSYVTGSDDFQSYVAGKALLTGDSPRNVADQNAARIQETLAKAGIRCDQFTRSLRPDYIARIQGMIERLYEQGHIVARECDYLVSRADGRHLFEFFVSGSCPHCASPSGGCICEECGRPNDGHDLARPVSTLGSGELTREKVTRLVVPLARYADRLRSFLDRTVMPTHVRSLAEGLIADGLPDVPVTHPHDWGIPCTVAGFEGQVVSTWFEMGHNMLEGVRRAFAAGDEIEVVQFFGFDNSFFYSLLYPLLYQLDDSGCQLPAAFVCNEFYLLEGKKFSTSRNHLIWARDFLEAEPVDLVRFYLAYTRPETVRTSFSTGEYRAFVDAELLGTWRSWLHDLGRRVREHCAGGAPEPGLWTGDHKCFFAQLEESRRRMQASCQASGFSLQALTRELMELVRRAAGFAQGEKHWARVGRRRDEHRTAIALELAAARALAQHAAPVMPEFGRRLWSALGLAGEVEARGFDDHLAWVPAGASVELAGDFFAGSQVRGEAASAAEGEPDLPALQPLAARNGA
jgi:methionyl-tRNA synthetase